MATTRSAALLLLFLAAGCGDTASVPASPLPRIPAWERLVTPTGGGPDLYRQRVEGGWLYLVMDKTGQPVFVPDPVVPGPSPAVEAAPIPEGK